MSVVFEPLGLGSLRVKNRILRSSVAGRWDNYDGSGTPVRIAWEQRFARGGVGAIISSNVPVHPQGRLVPGYAYIDTDDKVPFWRTVVERVHELDCKYILQLAHAGRERIVPGIEYETALGASDEDEPMNGFPARAMSTAEVREAVRLFADGARRAAEAGVDGIELAGANGVLFTQFLSSAINDRTDEYGGSLANRARFSLEVVRAIREVVGRDLCLGFKISVEEALNELLPWKRRGNTLEESLQVCRWLEEAGVDYLHVSSGAGFPHPRNPVGDFPAADVVTTYDSLLSSGRTTFRNYLVFRTWPLSRLFTWWWERPGRRLGREGINLAASRAVKQAVKLPVLCTGGFQTRSVIERAIEDGSCDGVTIARPLLANPNLVHLFAEGADRAPRPCTYANKCLFAFLENPLACYDESRFDSREQMIEAALSIYAEARATP